MVTGNMSTGQLHITMVSSYRWTYEIGIDNHGYQIHSHGYIAMATRYIVMDT